MNSRTGSRLTSSLYLNGVIRPPYLKHRWANVRVYKLSPQRVAPFESELMELAVDKSGINKKAIFECAIAEFDICNGRVRKTCVSG